MLSKQSVALAALAIAAPSVLAGFDSSANNNIAVYWGQNSYGQADSQSRLATYCSNTNINIIPLAFLDVIKNPTTVNFANADNNCTAIEGSTLEYCSQIEEDIKSCQSTYGKTILLSIGGSTYTEGGFNSSSDAEQWADTIWAMFGPEQNDSSVARPFGTAVVDGFDFDFESTTQNMAPFAQRIRSNMDAAADKKYFLSAAPQCPYPDASDNDMLAGAVSFDFIMVQFYNNFCDASAYDASATTQNAYNFDTWDNWAKTVSANPDVKVLLGIPANQGGANAGSYTSGTQLADVIAYSKGFSSFGGIMMWDMSQLWENPGFLDSVVSDLGGAASTQPTTTSTTGTTSTTSTTGTSSTTSTTATTSSTSTTATTSSTSTTGTTSTTSTSLASKPGTPTTLTTSTKTSPGSTSTATGSLVPQWGQCGGTGYTGSTVCQSPYTCVATSSWWAQCE